jgi:hypothetical protein
VCLADLLPQLRSALQPSTAHDGLCPAPLPLAPGRVRFSWLADGTTADVYAIDTGRATPRRRLLQRAVTQLA